MKIRLKIRRIIWLEIAAASTAVACVLAVLITIGAASTTAAVKASGQTEEPRAATEQIYEGMVTCSRCGARHSAARGKTAADCVRICAHDGASFALVDGEKTYTLEGDPTLLKTLAGERVRISGVATGNTVRVVALVANP